MLDSSEKRLAHVGQLLECYREAWSPHARWDAQQLAS